MPQASKPTSFDSYLGLLFWLSVTAYDDPRIVIDSMILQSQSYSAGHRCSMDNLTAVESLLCRASRIIDKMIRRGPCLERILALFDTTIIYLIAPIERESLDLIKGVDLTVSVADDIDPIPYSITTYIPVSASTSYHHHLKERTYP